MISGGRRTPAVWSTIVAASWIVGSILGTGWYRVPLDLFQTLRLPAGEGGHPPPSAPGVGKSRVIIVDVSGDPGEGTTTVPGATLARVIDKVGELGAWAVGVDVALERSSDAPTDRTLERSIGMAQRVILASRPGGGTGRAAPDRLAAAALSSGTSLDVADASDGCLRMVRHCHDQQDLEPRYSLTLQMARLMLSEGEPRLAPVSVFTDGLTVACAGGESLEIPRDRSGMTLVQYRGPAGTIPAVRWRELLALTRGQLDLTARAVMIGDARPGSRDARLMPFHRGAASRMSGVEVHAQDLLGMLSGSVRRTAGPLVDWGTGLAGAVVGCWAGRRRPIWTLAIFPAGVLACWLGGYALFLRGLVFVNPFPGTLAATLSAVGALAWLASRRRSSLDDEVEDPRLRRGMELVAGGRAGEAVLVFQEILSAGGSTVDLARWGLAMAFLSQSNIRLALTLVDGLDALSLPAGHVYDLADMLERSGALGEAEQLFAHVRTRDPRFLDAAARERRLAGRDRRVPDSLRRRLIHRYTDLGFVGAGGMARVYRAYDRERRELVAIKVPEEELLGDQELRSRFRREVEMLRLLTHPHIVRLHDVGPEEFPYYAMELVAGRSLKGLFDETGALPAARALRILVPIASALSASHARGVIHRDIKPANILLAGGDVPKLTDFGVAYLVDRTRLTAARATVGTPAYMAPEQLKGDEPTPAVDVYAFGVVLYEALASRTPFRTDSLFSRLMEEAVPVSTHVPGVPAALDALLGLCLSRDPARRPGDGARLYNALEPIARGCQG